MQSIGTQNTGPEWTVRRALHSRGYRYRLHRKDLPGKPDIVLPSQKKAIFVHGCFWHAHGCAKGQAPKSKLEYWGPKLEANVARDKRNVRDLEARGWLVLTLWQCETKEEQVLLAKLLPFVENS